MKVLLTGGAGYIGSHLAYELCQRGDEVIVVDNLSTSNTGNYSRLKYRFGDSLSLSILDLCDRSATMGLFARTKPDAVIHLAAYKSVGESIASPLKYYSNNLGALLSVLDGMKHSGCHRLVFSSSCTVYGDSPSLPYTEDTPFGKALSPYGRTKQLCEEIISDTVRTEGWLNSISLRYFNPIGAHPSGLIGETPTGTPSNILPVITRVAREGGGTAIEVFGHDYPTPDGTCLRDYIDIYDLVCAHILALDRVGETPLESFNLGTGRPVSTLQLIETFKEANRVDVPYRFTARRTGDMAQAWADVQKAESMLGWRAEVPLFVSLQSAYNWEVKNGL